MELIVSLNVVGKGFHEYAGKHTDLIPGDMVNDSGGF